MKIRRRRMGWAMGAAALVSAGLWMPGGLAAVVYTEPVGFCTLEITPGTNSLSVPMQRLPAFQGRIASVTSNTVSVSGSPWTNDQWARSVLHTLTNFQYLVIVRKDEDTNVPVAGNCEGDWWLVVSNTTNTLTVVNGAEDLTGTLGTNDQIEVRHLTTVADLFGTGASCLLNKDTNGIAGAKSEDVIRPILTWGLGDKFFYHSGNISNEGYYSGTVASGRGPFTGDELTIAPDDVIAFYRQEGKPGTNLVSMGAVQTRWMTHYFGGGWNTMGIPYPVSAAITNANLLESGWKVDTNGTPNQEEEDLLCHVTQLNFDSKVMYSTFKEPPGWYLEDGLTNGFCFEPGQVYAFFIQGTNGFRWRQKAPLTITP